jgi:Ca-activated chloride channel family protein
LAKKHGIATPYTSYLIVPDGATPVANAPAASPMPGVGNGLNASGGYSILQNGTGGAAPGSVNYAPVYVTPQIHWAMPNGAVASTATPCTSTAYVPVPTVTQPSGYRPNAAPPSPAPVSAEVASTDEEEEEWESAPSTAQTNQPNRRQHEIQVTNEELQKKQLYEQARAALQKGDRDGYQAGNVGVELSVHLARLRNQCQVEAASSRRIGNRNCLLVGGVWIDEGFDSKAPLVAVKALSKAYFRILERHAEMKPVFQLGNRLVWMTPSGKALVIDLASGKEELSDEEIDLLFAAKKE